MSGNATQTRTRRLPKPLFEAFTRVVQVLLAEHSVEYRLPTELACKQDFGDIDVLVASEDWTPVRDAWLKVVPEPRMSCRNGFTHVAMEVSPGEYAQVDFVHIPREQLDMAKLYYSHGVIFNHVGLLCRSIGLKFGFQGLSWRVIDPDSGRSVGKDILITRNPEEALSILGFPRQVIVQLMRGAFGTREDTYEVLRTLPFFTTEAFDASNMSAANRTRDKKRPETANLREWLLDKEAQSEDYALVLGDVDRYDKPAVRGTFRAFLLGPDRYAECLRQEAKILEDFRTRNEKQDAVGVWLSDLRAEWGFAIEHGSAILRAMASENGGIAALVKIPVDTAKLIPPKSSSLARLSQGTVVDMSFDQPAEYSSVEAAAYTAWMRHVGIPI